MTTEELASQIFQTITQKGWVLYYRGPANVRVMYEETLQRGPVDSLEPDVLYLIIPQAPHPHSRLEETIKAFIAKYKVIPKIIVPRDGYSYFGRVIYQSSDGETVEDSLKPGETIIFIGIQLLEQKVRLHAPNEVFIPYDVFLTALQSLPDISDIERSPEKWQLK